jgi:peroxiredoxin
MAFRIDKSLPVRRNFRSAVAVALLAAVFAGVSIGLSLLRVDASPTVAEEAAAMLRRYKPDPLRRSLDEVLADPERYYVASIEHELVGRTAPQAALLNMSGEVVQLSDYLGGGPVVLVFYLGYWCDHCVVQLFDIDEEIEKFDELGARVVAVSPDLPEETIEKFRRFGRFRFEVLSDPDNSAAKAFDCFDPADEGRSAKQFHGSFVIDGSGKIVWADISEQPFRSVKTLLYEVAKIQGRAPAP